MADGEEAAASAAAGRPGNPTTGRPSRRAILGRLLLLAAILGFVFAVVLPLVVDYQTVVDALSGLSAWQLAAVAGATALAYAGNAAPAWIMTPGLSWPRAIGSDLAGRAVVSTIPGPTDIATKFVLYRQWAIPADMATTAIVFEAFFETLSDLALPLIATVGVILAGHAPRPTVLWLSIVGVAVLATAMLVLVAIVRSESLARRLGRALEWAAVRAWGRFGRPAPAGIARGVLAVRRRSQETLSRRGALGFVAAILARLAWFVVLQISLWSVGVPSEVLPPSAVLTSMAAVALVALVPITPGGVGVSEVALIGLLSTVAGSHLAGPITAAVVIFRFCQWFAPIPIGWVLLVIMRGSHWQELDADAASGGAEESADAFVAS